MGSIVYPTTLVNDTVANADDVQGNFDAVIAEVNGNLDDTNIAPGGIGTGSIADASITDPKIVDVDGAKIQAGTLPLSALGFPLAGGPGNLPVGAVIAWASTFEPAQFKLCNGQALDKATYALLYAVIADEFSTATWQGANPSDFKVPDLRQRIAVGLGSNGFVNDLGLNEGTDKDAVASGTPFHGHDWDMAAHTHAIGSHTHGVSAHQHNVPLRAFIPGQDVILANNPAGFVTQPTADASVAVGSGGPSIRAPYTHNHQIAATALQTAAYSGQFASHNTAVDGSTSTNSTSASNTGAMNAVATQTTDLESVPFLVLNYLIYTGV